MFIDLVKRSVLSLLGEIRGYTRKDNCYSDDGDDDGDDDLIHSGIFQAKDHIHLASTSLLIRPGHDARTHVGYISLWHC